VIRSGSDPDFGEHQADPGTQETIPRSESPKTPVEDVGAIFDPRPKKSTLEAVETIPASPEHPETPQETAENFMADEASPELEKLAEDMDRKSPSTPEALGDGLTYEAHPEKPAIPDSEIPEGHTAENLMEEEGNPESDNRSSRPPKRFRKGKRIRNTRLPVLWHKKLIRKKPGFEVVVEPNEDDLAAMENGVGASKNNLLVLGTGPNKVEPVPEEMPETEADAILEDIVESQAEEGKPGPDVLAGIAERQLAFPRLEEVPKIDSPVEKDYQKELPKLVMSAQHP
ncbi:unnamed protein product, partial [Mesorhabditis spiculigera]